MLQFCSGWLYQLKLQLFHLSTFFPFVFWVAHQFAKRPLTHRTMDVAPRVQNMMTGFVLLDLYRVLSARECHEVCSWLVPRPRTCNKPLLEALQFWLLRMRTARKPVLSRPSPISPSNGDCHRGIFRSFAGSEPFSTVEWRKVTAIHCRRLHFCKDHVETQKEQWEKDISRVHWCFAPDHSRGVRVAQWARIVSQFEMSGFHEWVCYSVS